MPSVTIHITIPVKVHQHLTEHLAGLMKPPHKDPATGRIISEPMYPSDDPVSEWMSDITSVNITEILRARLSPPTEWVTAQQEAEAAAQKVRDLYKPAVTSTVNA